MFYGKKLKITAKGLENGLRKSSDGIAFFGTSEKKDVYIKYFYFLGKIYK